VKGSPRFHCERSGSQSERNGSGRLKRGAKGAVSKHEDLNARQVVNGCDMRGKTHSSHGDKKAYLNFELKDHGRPERYYGATATSDLTTVAHLIPKGVSE
jgi:hypothetical protein